MHTLFYTTYLYKLPSFKKMCNPQMIIAALDFGSAAICNTDYLEVYDAFLSGGSGDGGGSTASRRLITRYCGNVSRQILVFEYQVLHSRFETLSTIRPLHCKAGLLQRGGIYYFFLFSTFISENQGLEKSRSASNFRKSCKPGFFFSLSPIFFFRFTV